MRFFAGAGMIIFLSLGICGFLPAVGIFAFGDDELALISGDANFSVADAEDWDFI
jgi:hypothetical protein